jgi:hypothetical protein
MLSKPWIRLFLVSLLLAVPLSAAKLSTSSTGPMWIELGPGGAILARNLAPGTTCPQINIDGNLANMTVRAASNTAYPVTTCEATVPAGAQKVSILGVPLTLPVKTASKIVVIGDTGCRIKSSKGKVDVQNCDDPKKWPFARLAKQAAKWGPDLVVHVGDYLYRESKCPDPKKCSGSPFGDNWMTWNADFFTPAAPLLAAAPWAMSRGNHEICKRAGTGFFRFMETSSPMLPCADFMPPYAVPAGSVTLLMFDSSAVVPLTPEEGDSGDAAPTGSSQLPTYTQQFGALAGLAGSNNWLVMHHPLRGARDSKTAPFEAVTDTLWTAAGTQLPASLDAVVTGHVHFTEVLSFDQQATQIILGGGGTKLTKDVNDSAVKGASIGGWTVTHAKIIDDFGYATFESTGASQWNMTVYGQKGDVQMTCTLNGNSATCKKAT